MQGQDPNKVVVALGAYGLDWPKGGHADPVTFHEATLHAQESGVFIDYDQQSLNPTYSYAEEDGTQHEVWFLDAVTMFNQMHVADAWRPRGYAVCAWARRTRASGTSSASLMGKSGRSRCR